MTELALADSPLPNELAEAIVLSVAAYGGVVMVPAMFPTGETALVLVDLRRTFSKHGIEVSLRKVQGVDYLRFDCAAGVLPSS